MNQEATAELAGPKNPKGLETGLWVDLDNDMDKFMRQVLQMLCRWCESQHFCLDREGYRYAIQYADDRYFLLRKMKNLVELEMEEHAKFLSENEEVMERLKKGLLPRSPEPQERGGRR